MQQSDPLRLVSVSLLWPQLAEAVLYTPTPSISKVRLTVASDYIVDSLKSLGKDKVSFAYLAPWQEERGCILYNSCSPLVAEFRRLHTVRRDRQMLFVCLSLIMFNLFYWLWYRVDYYHIFSSLLLHAACIVQLKINYFSMNHYKFRSNLLSNAWPMPVKNILPNLYTGLKKIRE